ncbi:MAG: hypothetical protein ACUVX9_07325 [Anaerolineae bacterium]
MSGPIKAASGSWLRTAAGNARVESGGVLRLSVLGCGEGESACAQVEDEGLNRGGERGWSPPLLLQARLRFCPAGGQLAGTAGLGFCSRRRGLSDRDGLRQLQWLWFYYVSPASAVSLLPGPPHGLKASALGQTGGSLAATAVAPLLQVRGTLAHHRLPAVEMSLSRSLMTGWHTVRLAWLPHVAVFSLDGQQVLQTRLVPTGPLFLLAWMDNVCVWLTEEGASEVGTEAVPEPQCLEISDLFVQRP